MEGRDDFPRDLGFGKFTINGSTWDETVGAEHGAPPFSDAPPPCKRPHARVTHRNNDVRLNKGYLLLEQVESGGDLRGDEHVSEWKEPARVDADGEPLLVLFSELGSEPSGLAEPEADVVAGRAFTG